MIKSNNGQRRSGALRCAHVVSALAVCAAIGIAASPAHADPKPNISQLTVGPITVDARRIASFDRLNSPAERFGDLVWQGGLVLTSPSPYFGGWSGLAIDSDGRNILAVSDSGIWMKAQIEYDGERPKALSGVTIGPLLARNGKPPKRDRDRDAESIALISGTISKGTVYIGFEQNHRIGLFDTDAKGVSTAKLFLQLPPAALKMRRNRGFEAMTLIKAGPMKGAVVAISERLLDVAGRHTGWIFQGNKPRIFHLTDIDNYDITDIAALSDGSLLVLERRYRILEGVKSRIRLIAADDLKPDAVLNGKVILDATMAQEIDNFEAIAVHTAKSGDTIITLMSDDNFNKYLQRSLLVQFKLSK